VAWRLLGEALLAVGKRPEALEALRHALALAPGDEVLGAAVDTLAAEPLLPPAAAVTPSPLAPAPARSEPTSFTDPFAATPAEARLQAVAASDVFAAPPLAASPSFDDEPFASAGPLPGGEIGALEDVFWAPSAPAAGRLEAAVPGLGVPEIGLELAPPALALQAAPEGPFAELAAVEPMPLAAAPPVDEAPAGVGVGPAPVKTTERMAFVRPTLTLARLYVQQEDFPAAIAVLERLLEGDAGNQEASDLLDLIQDMMAPLPEGLPTLSVRERKIAALQRWLASLTLARERVAG
jgi:tetratricopeptide (TPR) repeat protein